MTTSPTCASPKCTNKAHDQYVLYCNKHAYAKGVINPRVDATMARHHAQRLIDTGVTKCGIAEAAGISDDTILSLMAGTTKKLRRRTHNAIMAVTPREAVQHIPTWQLARRIRALRAAGWRTPELAEHTGLSEATLLKIQNEHWQHVRRRNALRIRDTYTQLANHPVRPPTAWVARQHWAKPMEWDNIDDPNEHRDGIALGRLNPTFVTANRVKPDEALHAKLDALHAHYGTQKSLADALGYHPSSIANHMNRQSKTIDVDVYVHIMNHQPDQKENAA